MSRLWVRPSRQQDAAAVALRLEEQDRRTIEVMTGENPEQGILRSMGESKPLALTGCWGAGICESPIAVFGIKPFLLPGDGRFFGEIWCVATETARRECWREFTSWTRRWLEGLPHDVLVANEWAENDLHVRWLRRLGFDLAKRFEIREGGEQFLQLHRMKGVAA